MTDMLTSMKQYSELVEEYKIKVLSCARTVILLLSPPQLIFLFLKISIYFFKFVFRITPISKGHTQLWDRADVDSSFSHFEKSSPQPGIKVHSRNPPQFSQCFALFLTVY